MIRGSLSAASPGVVGRFHSTIVRSASARNAEQLEEQLAMQRGPVEFARREEFGGHGVATIGSGIDGRQHR
jgi:hypothetical protein